MRESTYGRFTDTIGEVLTHAVLHGPRHRGEAARLVRQAAIDLPPTEVIACVLARAGGGAGGRRSAP